MTVVKGDVDVWKHSIIQFIRTDYKDTMKISLVAPLPVQMHRVLANMCVDYVRDGVKPPKELFGSPMAIPTTNEKGKLYVEYEVDHARYRLTLRLDNYIVQQTIPESAYV